MTTAAKTLPEQREAVARLEELRRRAAGGDITAYYSLCHRDELGQRLVPPLHHVRALQVLERPDEFPFVAFIWPPGYGKSTITSVVYPAFRIGQMKGRIRMAIIGNTATLAQGFAGAVRDTILTPSYRATFPDVKPDRDRRWANDAFYVTNTPIGPNPTLAATGLGGLIVGRRLDEIILDDPTSFEQARSETVMEQQRDVLKNTLVMRLPPGRRPPRGKGARIVAALTRWHERDLLPSLVDMGFYVLHMPGLALEENDPLGRAPGEPLWPNMEDRATLEAMREEDEIIFELVYQGNVGVLAGDIFDSQFWQRGQPPMRPGEMDKRRALDFIAQYVDTAGGKSRRKGDWTVIVTIGRRGNTYWVLDVSRGRWAEPEQEIEVVRAARLWKPDTLVIEDTNEGRALYSRLVLNYRLPLKPYDPSDPKEYRAIPLANAYRAWRVWHPEDAKWRRSFEAEMEAFPNGRHDDQVDAAAGAFNHCAVDRGMRIRGFG